MKGGIKNKLTIIIEATKLKNLSSDVIKSIRNLEKTIASHKGVSLILQNDSVDSGVLDQQSIASSNTGFVSPENWEYWPG